ncbi:hypothetical protein [Paenibacillus agilis]|uniref:Uncharacterized protein n=1 Tax=Paenibacillus agilis TaxID=3020863 RepID=A0A559IQ17_9BACL|nr:hypothetical protein [Paenibacillus agilis]TVX89680.1 hypothetical protein FPZ44_18120 [Paenibacillus agilis]
MFGSNGFGFGNKSARVGDQIDAEVKGLKNVVNSVNMVAQQFDFVEAQLQQFAQIIGNSDPMAAMQFQNLQAQINNIQGQIVASLGQINQGLTNIDALTDKIQN